MRSRKDSLRGRPEGVGRVRQGRHLRPRLTPLLWDSQRLTPLACGICWWAVRPGWVEVASLRLHSSLRNLGRLAGPRSPTRPGGSSRRLVSRTLMRSTGGEETGLRSKDDGGGVNALELEELDIGKEKSSR
jgi:hypothetical protein